MEGSFHECTKAKDSLSSVFVVRNFNCPLIFITIYWYRAFSHGIGKSAHSVIQWGQCQMLSGNLKSETSLMLWLNPDVGEDPMQMWGQCCWGQRLILGPNFQEHPVWVQLLIPGPNARKHLVWGQCWGNWWTPLVATDSTHTSDSGVPATFVERSPNLS